MSATEVKQSFGAALDAAQREPVIIQKQNRDVAVLLSMQEYEKLRGLRIDLFDRLAKATAAKAVARGLTDEKFEELMTDVS
jgi:prevent-host-death family protein